MYIPLCIYHTISVSLACIPVVFFIVLSFYVSLPFPPSLPRFLSLCLLGKRQAGELN